MMEVAREVGFVNLMTKGLGPRLLMVGTLTGLQWWTYDTFKVRPFQRIQLLRLSRGLGLYFVLLLSRLFFDFFDEAG